MDQLQKKLSLSDSWSIDDIASVLAKNNNDQMNFFKDILYSSVEAGKLKPINLYASGSRPLRFRDFNFKPDDIINWAYERNLSLPKLSDRSIIFKGFDPNNENYAEELDVANQVWHWVVNKRDKSLSFKAQALKILNESYKHLSNTAIKRIAMIVNTDNERDGGRPKQSDKPK